jgi:two-component system sensor histidine kinase UhpB
LIAYEGSVEDITARKNAEYALRDSEERLRLSLSATHLGIWDWNILTGHIIWSDTVAPILGLAPGAFPETYRAYMELIYPDDRELVNESIARSVEAGVEYALEHRVQWSDGTVRWVACKGDVLRNQGIAQRMLGTVQDVTDRKQGEAELQSVLRQLRTLSGRLEVIREEERGRIARELHDEFGVGLTCLKIDLSRLTTLIRGTVGLEKGRLINEKIRAMTEFIDTTIGGVQRIVSELRPAILDDLGLVAAIEWQAQDFQRRTGIICTSDMKDEPVQVDRDRATVIFRICQEALTNVARHAGASTVAIRLEQRDDSVTLVVEDNGQGIEARKIADLQSLGLLGMRERAELLGGTVTIVGCSGKGTIVTLRLPCSRATSNEEGSC